MGLLIEVVALAAIANMVSQGLNFLGAEVFFSYYMVLAAVAVVDFLAAWALADNSFLASHVHSILLFQLASLAVFIGMLVAMFWDDYDFRHAFWCFVVCAIFGGLIFWFWGYFQAYILADQIGRAATKPAFYQQLGFVPKDSSDAGWARSHIRAITFGPTAWWLALVGFVASLGIKYALLQTPSAKAQPPVKYR